MKVTFISKTKPDGYEDAEDHKRNKELWTASEGDVKAYEICNDEVAWTEAIKDMF